MLFLVSKPDDLWELNVEHKISDNFCWSTFLKMTERPFTQKSSFGQESVNNTIFGLFSAEVPFFDKIENGAYLDTDVPSNLSVREKLRFETRFAEKQISLKENQLYMWMILKARNRLSICVQLMAGVFLPQIGMSEAHMILMPSQMI
jgi:cell surface protein SprA